jgi:hypothetical protein
VTLIAQSNLDMTEEPEWLVELALRLASDPSEVVEWAGQNVHFGLMRLLELPTLARAARFLVIATDHYLKSRAESGDLYASWKWT